MNKFTTTITQEFYNIKMEDLKIFGFFEEYKDITPFWKKRFIHLSPPTRAIFLVGSDVHEFVLVGKKIITRTEIPEKYQSAIRTEKAFAFRCVQNIETNNQTKLVEFAQEKMEISMPPQNCEFECAVCTKCQTCGAGEYEYNKSCVECQECRISCADIDAGMP